MSLKTIYPSFPPIARGNPSVIKTDAKRERIIYANSRTVVIKNVADPTKVQLFTGHQYPVTAVAMSPSGAYMATGDKSGKLMIWACDTPEQIIKGDYPMLGGSILDIDWSPDNARIVVVGEGQPPAKVIMWDSGNSVGEVGGGHIKKIVSCSYKPTRPFRVITGSEDLKVNFYEGPPFKFKGTAKSHERFPNCVRYSPDGEKFFSVGSDQMLSVFDGKESTLLIERKVHTGSIYSASWKLDSPQIVTCSADKSVKVVDASTLEEVASFTLGSAVEDMQIGCAFLADSILSYSLNGAMSFLDPAAPAAPPRVEWDTPHPSTACAPRRAGSSRAASRTAPTSSGASHGRGTSAVVRPRPSAARHRAIASPISRRAPTGWWSARRTTRSPSSTPPPRPCSTAQR